MKAFSVPNLLRSQWQPSLLTSQLLRIGRNPLLIRRECRSPSSYLRNLLLIVNRWKMRKVNIIIILKRNKDSMVYNVGGGRSQSRLGSRCLVGDFLSHPWGRKIITMRIMCQRIVWCEWTYLKMQWSYNEKDNKWISRIMKYMRVRK